jgi:hypothetical protein
VHVKTYKAYNFTEVRQVCPHGTDAVGFLHACDFKQVLQPHCVIMGIVRFALGGGRSGSFCFIYP